MMHQPEDSIPGSDCECCIDGNGLPSQAGEEHCSALHLPPGSWLVQLVQLPPLWEPEVHQAPTRIWLACSKVRPMLTSLINRWAMWFQRARGSTGWGVGIRLRLSCTDAMSVWTALHVKVLCPKSSSMLVLKTELSTPPENAWQGQNVLMRLYHPLTDNVHPLRWAALFSVSYCRLSQLRKTHDLTWSCFQISFSKYNLT